jgi:type II secretory pathway pseudopilin PulG
MRKHPLTAKRKRGEGGYALLMAVFLMTVMLIATITAAPSIRTERQREKEEEMIWRGKQYVRAIKLYYRKNGKFPTNLDDLIKPKNGSLRYLRQDYKDPMNKEDGSWRLIYVGPAGQLIGSLKPPQTPQLPGQLSGAVGGGQLGTPVGSAFGNSSSSFGSSFGSGFGSSFGPAAGQRGGSPQGAFGSTSGFGAQPNDATAGGPRQPQTGAGQPQAGAGNAAGAAPQGQCTNGSDSNGNPCVDPNAAAPVDTSNFVGGNIIGIGSKAIHPSIIVYETAKNYHLFEFVWDPSKDIMSIGGTGTGTQVGTPVGPGQTPGQGFGQGIGAGQPGTFGNQPSTFGNQGNQPGQQNPQPAGNSGQGPGVPTTPPLAPNTPPE